MQKYLILITSALLMSATLSSQSIIESTSTKLNSPYFTSFFDKAIEESQIDIYAIDTLYVLEHYNDISYLYDRGILWTSNGDYKCFILKSDKNSKKGTPYRSATGIEFVDADHCDQFQYERTLIEHWSIDEIKALDAKKQNLDDGTFTVIRIIRIKKKKFSSDVFQFQDLKDY